MATDLSQIINEQDHMLLTLRTANRRLAIRVREAEELAERLDRQVKGAYHILDSIGYTPGPDEDLPRMLARVVKARVNPQVELARKP